MLTGFGMIGAALRGFIVANRRLARLQPEDGEKLSSGCKQTLSGLLTLNTISSIDFASKSIAALAAQGCLAFPGARSMGFYDRYILPPLIDLACGARPIGLQRAKVVPAASGVVLELGFGTGRNLPHYDRSKVTRLYALEPSPGMLVRARKMAAGSDLPVEILPETAEALSLGPQSVDTVVVTYSLCTIPDPAAAARRRSPGAQRPEGCLVVLRTRRRAPDAEVRRTQARIEPLWKRLAGGSHLTRDIPALIQDAGFRIQQVETMYLPGTPGWAGFNTWGVAAVS